jgi:hypothetical protein
MFDEDNNGYGNEVQGDTEFVHRRSDFCVGERCFEDNGKGKAMSKIKLIELLLAAIYTLISAALSVVKFINQVDKLKHA